MTINICKLQVGFSKMRGLAFDGRCKTFDASADGFARGEGIGSVWLTRGTGDTELAPWQPRDAAPELRCPSRVWRSTTTAVRPPSRHLTARRSSVCCAAPSASGRRRARTLDRARERLKTANGGSDK